MNGKLAAASKIERKLNLKLKMKLDKARGLNGNTTGTLRALCYHLLQGIVGHPHINLGRVTGLTSVWGEIGGVLYSYASPTHAHGSHGCYWC